MCVGKTFLLLSSVLLVGCSTFRGAMEPYSLSPKSSAKTWEPPKHAITKTSFSLEDFAKLEEHNEYSLAELINIALLNNPQTKVSWDDARVASAQYGESLSGYFPFLDLNGSWERSKGPDVSDLTAGVNTAWDTVYNTNAAFSYTILDFGQIRATSTAALMSLYSADWMHNRQIQTTISVIMNDFYNYLYEKDLLTAKYADLDNAKATLDAAKERLKTGMDDLGDLLQAQTTYLSAKLNVTNQKQNLHNSYTLLSKDMGLPPQIKLKTQNFPDQTPEYEVQPFEHYLDIAKRKRPDYLASIATVASKKQLLYKAERDNYPVVSGTMDIGKTWSNNGVEDDYDFQAIVSVTVPFFHGFEIQNSINRAKSVLKKAEDKQLQLEVDIMREISDYTHDINYARDLMNDSKEFLESAIQEFKINLKKYRVGTANILDVISAQAAVADAQAQNIQAKSEWYISLANLAYSTGSLTTSEETQ